MHGKSSKLPIKGENHTFRITELTGVEYHKKKAEEHYKTVKRTQWILDYNSAVDTLGDLYDTVMQAQETEDELKKSLAKVKKTEEKINATLNVVQQNLGSMKSQIQKCNDRLLLSKAKMQNLGMSIKDLKKVPSISQGTQADPNEETVVIDLDKEEEDPASAIPILNIPDDEDDIAVKQLLATENVNINVAKSMPQNVVTLMRGVPATSTVVVTEGGASGLTPQNIAMSSVTPQNVGTTTQNIPSTSGVTPQNIVVTTQNVGFTGQNVVSDVAQVTPLLPPGVISAPFPPQQQQQLQQHPVVVISDIPEGYKKTKYEDTLEKTDLKTISGQKAPKRFFCAKCMDKGIETGYTKRNDLTKHLLGCGSIREKKFKCTYEGCTAAYVRVDNLKQHVASQHTHAFLFYCKKCGKGFSTSPEATSHRKQCYPVDPDKEHTRDETDPVRVDPKEDNKKTEGEDV